MAFSKFSFPTMSTTKLCRVGISNVLAMPVSKPMSAICQTVTTRQYTNAASANASSMAAVWLRMRMARLSCRSATTPA